MTCELTNYLIHATKLEYKDLLCQTNEQWASRGATNFKRKIMGYCGTKTIKSADDLVNILAKMNPHNLHNEFSEESKNELATIVSKLDKQTLKYTWGSIYFEKIEPRNEENTAIKYLITRI